MRRKDDTLRDILLDNARELADKEGIGAVNIRSIALRAGVATGTVYNYFAGKDEILLALTEEYWKKTLLELGSAVTASSFCEQLEETYIFLRTHIDNSAGIFMRSLGNIGDTGKERMTVMQNTLGLAIIKQIDSDENVRKDIWTETFTKEEYARFILTNLVMLLRAPTPDFGFFIQLIKRTLY